MAKAKGKDDKNITTVQLSSETKQRLSKYKAKLIGDSANATLTYEDTIDALLKKEGF